MVIETSRGLSAKERRELALAAAWNDEEAAVTKIKQDTSKVHLIGSKGRALCKAEAGEDAIRVQDWAAGFTPAALGARVCRTCEEKAGTAARFEPGEKPEDGTTWRPIDS